MSRTALFESDGLQTVRLPKDLAFPEGVQSVTVLRDGPRRILTPSDAVWDDFFDSPGVDIGDGFAPPDRECGDLRD